MPSGSTTSATGSERKLVFACSFIRVVELYDFYLYVTLAPFFGPHFFPHGHSAVVLSWFSTYLVGFLVRPLGALVFGRIGDLAGRKPALVVTLAVIGSCTFGLGALPSYSSIGIVSPILLTLLRVIQGLAMGGEHAAAASLIAESSRPDRRGYTTSWSQIAGPLGPFLVLPVVYACHSAVTVQDFADWGWRMPFWFSLVLLALSMPLALGIHESPVFRELKAEGRRSKKPLAQSLLHSPNNRYVLLALLGATAGHSVVTIAGQYYALLFLVERFHLDYLTASVLIDAALIIGIPMIIIAGKLSDHIGRLKVILGGCLLAAITYIPLFKGLTHFIRPDLEAFQDRTTISVASDVCKFHLSLTPDVEYTPCDRARDFLSRAGLSFELKPGIPGQTVVTQIGDVHIEGWQAWPPAAADPRYVEALKRAGYVAEPPTERSSYLMALVILVMLNVSVAMVSGPLAAFLAEMFPAKTRCTSISVPYHVGNGWLGGLVPMISSALIASTGNLYSGLWYPTIIASMTVIVGFVFLRDAKPDFDIRN